MQYDQFIGQVQNRAHLASRGEAERAVAATMQVLSSRLTGGGASKLGAQLPDGVSRLLDDGAGGDRSGEAFDSDEFIQRVADAEGVDPPAAAFHARAVLETVTTAVQGDVLGHVRQQLPGDFDRLFAGSEGRMPRDD
jgi:uncharacterized protein (DUF2267 family)